MNSYYFKSYPAKRIWNPTFFFMLKLRMFGKKITEISGKFEADWYLYRGVLYMTKLKITKYND